jgi:hypothetical protein
MAYNIEQEEWQGKKCVISQIVSLLNLLLDLSFQGVCFKIDALKAQPGSGAMLHVPYTECASP